MLAVTRRRSPHLRGNEARKQRLPRSHDGRRIRFCPSLVAGGSGRGRRERGAARPPPPPGARPSARPPAVTMIHGPFGSGKPALLVALRGPPRPPKLPRRRKWRRGRRRGPTTGSAQEATLPPFAPAKLEVFSSSQIYFSPSLSHSLCPTLALSRNRHLLSHSLRFLLIFLNLPGKKKKAGCLAILF